MGWKMEQRKIKIVMLEKILQKEPNLPNDMLAERVGLPIQAVRDARKKFGIPGLASRKHKLVYKE